jgi:serine/threonine protein kinase
LIYTEKSDIYSFGIVCWEILSGGTKYPFEDFNASTKEELIKLIVDGKRPDLPATAHDEWLHVVNICWQGKNIFMG